MTSAQMLAAFKRARANLRTPAQHALDVAIRRLLPHLALPARASMTVTHTKPRRERARRRECKA
jgi:hypothetical protein